MIVGRFCLCFCFVWLLLFRLHFGFDFESRVITLFSFLRCVDVDALNWILKKNLLEYRL